MEGGDSGTEWPKIKDFKDKTLCDPERGEWGKNEEKAAKNTTIILYSRCSCIWYVIQQVYFYKKERVLNFSKKILENRVLKIK